MNKETLQCQTCLGSGQIETGIGMMVCDDCQGQGVKELVQVEQLTVPSTPNRYGLDTPYIVRWLNRVAPALENYRPAELARELGRLAATADKAALVEDQLPKAMYGNPTDPTFLKRLRVAHLPYIGTKAQAGISAEQLLGLLDHIDSLRADQQDAPADATNLEAELHKVVKRFANKRLQGYMMGALRRTLAEAERACADKDPIGDQP